GFEGSPATTTVFPRLKSVAASGCIRRWSLSTSGGAGDCAPSPVPSIRPRQTIRHGVERDGMRDLPVDAVYVRATNGSNDSNDSNVSNDNAARGLPALYSIDAGGNSAGAPGPARDDRRVSALPIDLVRRARERQPDAWRDAGRVPHHRRTCRRTVAWKRG